MIGGFSGRYDTYARFSQDEAHRQQHIADKPGDEHPVLIGLVEIEPVDSIRVVEHQPRKLERHAVCASVPLRLPLVPLEFVIPHRVLNCRRDVKPTSWRADAWCFAHFRAGDDGLLSIVGDGHGTQ